MARRGKIFVGKYRGFLSILLIRPGVGGQKVDYGASFQMKFRPRKGYAFFPCARPPVPPVNEEGGGGGRRPPLPARKRGISNRVCDSGEFVRVTPGIRPELQKCLFYKVFNAKASPPPSPAPPVAEAPAHLARRGRAREDFCWEIPRTFVHFIN